LKNEKKWDHEQIQKMEYQETIRILKIASKKYANPEYDALAKAADAKIYASEINQLTL
jgi:coenzyme F420-reducing hydrogenase delta subunit